jgi:GT2 family glycosyltransferase
VTATIIICTRNRCSVLKDTLESLDRVRVPANVTIEVVVVDNGSSDDTRAYLSAVRMSSFRFRSFEQPICGKSLALNAALASTDGDILIFLDDDVRPARDWLSELAQPILNGECDAVAGAVRIPNSLLRPWMRPAHFAWLAATDCLDQVSPETAIGANMACTRTVLSRVPGFDTELGPGRLGLWEDTLFSLQLRSAGYRLGMATSAIVEHHFDPSRLSRAAFLARALSEARSSAYVAWHWKHEELTSLASQIAEFSIRLAAKRLLYRDEWRRDEGVAQWEMDLVTGIEFARHYRVESQKSPAYDQYGWSKRRNDVSGIVEPVRLSNRTVRPASGTGVTVRRS